MKITFEKKISSNYHCLGRLKKPRLVQNKNKFILLNSFLVGR